LERNSDHGFAQARFDSRRASPGRWPRHGRGRRAPAFRGRHARCAALAAWAPARRARVAGRPASAICAVAVAAASGNAAVEENGDKLTGAAFGVAHDLLRSLARGEIAPEAELNLHHLSADAAAHQAERFIEQSVAKGRRCVLLIHGRGLHSGPSGPALRPALVEFLCRRPLAKQVLAFTSAPPRHGGAGALLVLLRRAKSSRP